jgi:hypothetical protein
MPLRDHFRGPLDKVHSWDGLMGALPAILVRDLHRQLPPEFAAGPSIQLGTVEENKNEPYDLPHQDKYEVRVHEVANYRRLFAVVQIVSPSNKDEPRHCREFVQRCDAFLKQGVCVVIVDLVTTLRASLYAELLAFLGQVERPLASDQCSLYASTCRLVAKAGPQRLEAWHYPVVVGEALPTLPLWLSETICVPLDLEASYEEACRILRIS